LDNDLKFAPCGYLSFDDGGTILSVNQTFNDWLGYEENELVGKSIEQVLTLSSHIFYNTHFFPLVKLHSRADEIFLTLLGKDKKDIPVLSNTIRKFDNGLYQNCSVFIPVFQRKKYEEEILHAQRTAERKLQENQSLRELTERLEERTKQLDRQYRRILAINRDLLQFSKIMSHDLQEPIRKIHIFATMLLTEINPEGSGKSRSLINKITSASERLRKLTYGIRQYVALDTENDVRTVDLNAVLSDARARAIAERKFDAVRLMTGKLPSIDGYPEQLELMFYHLIDNAIQFRTPGEDVYIQVSAVLLDENVYRATENKYSFTEHVRITFADNGIGLYKDYVFELVKKLNASTTGLGTGLSLVKKIVDNHSGSIQVQSEPGHGTKFIITLPLKMINWQTGS
jgi:phosphoserine phosphatase RsbU/P